jgi:small subunit ribosomal protein S20
LANTRSAIKRIRQNQKRRLRNRYFRGRARTTIKQARQAISAEDLETAREKTLEAIRALDKAAVKGVIHKNNASRRKSRLMKQLTALENTQA